MLSTDDLQRMYDVVNFLNKLFSLSSLVVPSEVVDFCWKADWIVDTENNGKCRESSLPVCSYTDPTRIWVQVFVMDLVVLGASPEVNDKVLTCNSANE